MLQKRKTFCIWYLNIASIEGRPCLPELWCAEKQLVSGFVLFPEYLTHQPPYRRSNSVIALRRPHTTFFTWNSATVNQNGKASDTFLKLPTNTFVFLKVSTAFVQHIHARNLLYFFCQNDCNKVGSYVSGLGSRLTFCDPVVNTNTYTEFTSLSLILLGKAYCCKRISCLIEFARIKMNA